MLSSRDGYFQIQELEYSKPNFKKTPGFQTSETWEQKKYDSAYFKRYYYV